MLDLKNMSPTEINRFAQELKKLPDDIKKQFLESLSEEEATELFFHPMFSLRPDQVIEWTEDKPIVFISAARGWGKSHCLTRTLKHKVEYEGIKEVALAAPTNSDLVNTLLFGTSGLMKCYPENHPNYPQYIITKQIVWFPETKTTVRLISAESPERSRGVNSELLLMDELGSFGNGAEEVVSNLFFGCRIGKAETLIITSPRNTPVIRNLHDRKDADVKLIYGTSFANAENLAPNFFKNAESYKGTARYRQEILGELILQNDEALLTTDIIDRVQAEACSIDRFVKFVIGVDPAGRSNLKSSDAFGIIVGGLLPDNTIQIIDDLTGKHTVEQWLRILITKFNTLSEIAPTEIAIESNGAGTYVKEVIVREAGRYIEKYITDIKSTANKYVRAEAATKFYYTSEVTHVRGKLPELESELVSWSGRSNEKSPNRIDALVFVINALKPLSKRTNKIRHFEF